MSSIAERLLFSVAEKQAKDRQESFFRKLGIESGHVQDAEKTLAWRYLDLADLCYRFDGTPTLEGFQTIVQTVDPASKTPLDLVIGKHDLENADVWIGFRGSMFDRKHYKTWVGSNSNLACRQVALDNFGEPSKQAGPEAAPGDPTGPDEESGNPVENAHVHAGFRNAFEELKKELMAWCENCRRQGHVKVIRLSGHSRGAALATLAGLYLARHYNGATVEVVTWASPKVGNKQFSKVYQECANLYFAGFRHLKDKVCQVPDWPLPYCHVYTPLRLDKKHPLQMILANSASDAHKLESYRKNLRYFIDVQGNSQHAVLQMGIEVADEKMKLTLTTLANLEASMEDKHKDIQTLCRIVTENFNRVGAALRTELYVKEMQDTLALIDWVAIQGADAATSLEHLGFQICKLFRYAAAAEPDEKPKMLEAAGQAMLAYVRGHTVIGTNQEKLEKQVRDMAAKARDSLCEVAQAAGTMEELLQQVPSLKDGEALWAVSMQRGKIRPLLLDRDVHQQFLDAEERDLLERRAKFMDKVRNVFKPLLEMPSGSEGPSAADEPSASHHVHQLVQEVLESTGLGKAEGIESLTSALRQAAECRSWRPQVVVTGPTKAGKSTLTNALCGKLVVSSQICPDSFLPVILRAAPQRDDFEVQIVGGSFKSFCKDPIHSCNPAHEYEWQNDLSELCEPQHFSTARGVQDWIQATNRRLRIAVKSLDDDRAQKWCKLCEDWAIMVEFPHKHVLRYDLVDLPGSSEQGALGGLIEKMVTFRTSRASLALLTVAGSQVKSLSPSECPSKKLLGGAKPVGGVWVVVTQVPNPDKRAELEPDLKEHCNKAPLSNTIRDVRFVHTLALLASGLLATAPFPPSCPENVEEKARCLAIYQGVYSTDKGMEDLEEAWEDGGIETAEQMEKKLARQVKKFPDTASLVEGISRLCFKLEPAMQCGPLVDVIFRAVSGIADSRHREAMNSRKSVEEREANKQGCQSLLLEDAMRHKLEDLREEVHRNLTHKVSTIMNTAVDTLGTREGELQSGTLRTIFNEDVAVFHGQNKAGGWVEWKGRTLQGWAAVTFEEKVFMAMGAHLETALKDIVEEMILPWVDKEVAQRVGLDGVRVRSRVAQCLQGLLRRCDQDTLKMNILEELDLDSPAKSAASAARRVDRADRYFAASMGAFLFTAEFGVTMPLISAAAFVHTCMVKPSLRAASQSVMGVGNWEREQWLKSFSELQARYVKDVMKCLEEWARAAVVDQLKSLEGTAGDATLVEKDAHLAAVALSCLTCLQACLENPHRLDDEDLAFSYNQ